MKKLVCLITLIFALFTVANAAEGDYIIKYKENAPMLLSQRNASYIFGGMYAVSKETAIALNDAGFLEICEPVITYTLHDTSAPDDTLFPDQWNLEKINADYAWSLKTFGNDVRVGIIDSGLALGHPDIDYSRVITGYNCADDNTDTTDTTGHGTKVAGIIAARINNNEGLCGIADKVKIVPFKVFNAQGGSSDLIIADAVIRAVDDFGCDVINLSLSSPEKSSLLDAVINYVLSKGCIVIASAGNNDTPNDTGNHLRYPAAQPGVIAVGSTDNDEQNSVSARSVKNDSVFICAPAGGIPVLSISGSSDYTTGSGTSFAAPQVAAAAAIAKSIDPALTPAEFADILKNTAYRPGATQPNNPIRDTEIGYGLLDIEAMIKYMLDGRTVYVSPYDTDSATVTLFNLTDSPVSVSSIFGAYLGSKMTDFDHKPITLDVGGLYTHIFTSEKSYTKLRHFLWKSLESVLPYENDYIPRELIIPVE